MSAQKGRVDMLQILLAAAADVYVPENGGTTLIYMGSHGGHVDVLQMLLAAKAAAFRLVTMVNLLS